MNRIIHAYTILSRSPFSIYFKKAIDEIKEAQTAEQDHSELTDVNPYFCPAIVNSVVSHYMGIIPLWSGMLLGNLRRYAVDVQEAVQEPFMTRDTDCHVKNWFGIVKQQIILKERRLRPGNFVRKLYEHVLQHKLTEELILKPLQPRHISQSQEGWSERDVTKAQNLKSRYFTAAHHIPSPKKQKAEKKENVLTRLKEKVKQDDEEQQYQPSTEIKMM